MSGAQICVWSYIMCVRPSPHRLYQVPSTGAYWLGGSSPSAQTAHSSVWAAPWRPRERTQSLENNFTGSRLSDIQQNASWHFFSFSNAWRPYNYIFRLSWSVSKHEEWLCNIMTLRKKRKRKAELDQSDIKGSVFFIFWFSFVNFNFQLLYVCITTHHMTSWRAKVL